MFAGYASRGYGGGAGGGSDDEDRKPDRNELFTSFPTKGKKKTQIDYDNELKIKQLRLKKQNMANLNKKIEELKESMVYKAINQEDSSDEDAIVMVPSDIPAMTLTTGGSNRMRSRSRSPKRKRGRSRDRKRGKRRGSPSSSPTSSSSSSARSRSRSRSRDRRRRKRSRSRSRSRDRKRDRKRRRSRSKKRSRKDKKRRKSSSSSPEVVEDRSKLSKNQRIFAKPKEPVKLAMKDIGNVIKNIERMPVGELFVNDYHPVHILRDFDRLPESDRIECDASLYATPYIVDPNDDKQLIKAPRSEALKENIHKKHVVVRFHNAKPNVKKTESVFRELDLPDDIDEIKISHMDGDFKYQHQIDEEEAAEKQKSEMLDEIRRELPCEEDTLLMEARLNIRNNPRDPKAYLDFIEVEEKINERNKQFGQPSNEQAQNERKIAILNQGIKMCAKSVELRIAKAEVENTEEAWLNLTFSFKSSLKVWAKYLDYVMYSSRLSVSKVDGVFKKIVRQLGEVLRGESRSHTLEVGTELFLYEVFIRRLKYWREIGQWELFIASIQASIEYTFFSPPSLLTSEMSHRRKMDLFRQYWESGCPRIGDKGWVPWESFNPEEWTPERSVKAEFIDVEKEEARVFRIHQKAALRPEKSNLKRWAYMDRHAANARCRPLRNDHYIDERNLESNRYVSFDDLHICELLNSQLLELLSFAGMKIIGQDNAYPDTISLARDYGVSTDDSFLPASALKIILRICRQLAIFSTDNIQLMYSMIPSFIPILNCTKQKTKNADAKVQARFKAYLASLKGKPCKGPKVKQRPPAESSDDEDGMEDEEPLPQLTNMDGDHQETKSVLIEFLAFHSYSCCTKAEKQKSMMSVLFADSVANFKDQTLSAQMAMNSILIAIVNVLDCRKEEREKNSELILRKLQYWVCKLAGYSDKEEEITAIRAQKAINEIMLRTKFERDDEISSSLSNIFPNYHSLAYCIDMWLIALRADNYSLVHIEKLTKKWTNFYADSKGEPLSCRAVHETLLNILYRDWLWFHRGKNELYFHLKYHMDSFPSSDQPIKIATNLLAANASIVSFSHKLDQIFGDYTGGGEVGKTRRALAHISVVLKKREQIQKSIDEKTGVHDVHTINEINRYLSRVCMREAGNLKDPYLWRLAMKNAHTAAAFEEAYIRATKTCRYSRELHLDAVDTGDEITEKNAVKMMTEFGMRMNATLEELQMAEDLAKKQKEQGILK